MRLNKRQENAVSVAVTSISCMLGTIRMGDKRLNDALNVLVEMLRDNEIEKMNEKTRRKTRKMLKDMRSKTIIQKPKSRQ